MKILVTGGMGFVGSRLIPLLREHGYHMAVLDNQDSSLNAQGFEFYHGDICNLDHLTHASKDCGAIIHLAALHKDNVRPISCYDLVNIEGTRNVCQAAEKNGINTIIFTSSVAVYGLNTRANEATPPQPFNDYGRTKLLAEQVLRKWQSADCNRSLTIIRPTVIFGEGNRGNVYNLLKQIAEGPFIMIGHGRNRKALAYVGNVVNFLLQSLSFGKGVHLYNYADTPDLTMNELISTVKKKLDHRAIIQLRVPRLLAYLGASVLDALAKITKKEFPISRVRVKKFTADTIYDTHNIERLNFERPFNLIRALENTINYEFLSQ